MAWGPQRNPRGQCALFRRPNVKYTSSKNPERIANQGRSSMAAIAFVINGRKASVDVAPDTPLLWIVREHLKLTGTKFGCGTGLCGACTVHVDGRAARSCQVTASQVAGKRVTTIEGLSPNADHPLQTRLDRGAGAAMRLLPVRPDHAGGGAAGDATRSRRASRSSSTWTAISAAAGPIRASSAPSNAPPEERDMTSKRNKSAAAQPPRDARRFGRPVVRLRARRAVAVRRERCARAGRAARLNAYVVDRQGRHHHDHVAGARNGPGRSTPRCR